MNMSHFHITIIAGLLIVLSSLSSELHGLESMCISGPNVYCGVDIRPVMCGWPDVSYTVSTTEDCRPNKLDCLCSSGNHSQSPLKMIMTNKTVGYLTVSFKIVNNIILEVPSGDKLKDRTEIVLRVNNTLNETECHKKGNHFFEDLMKEVLWMYKCNSSESCDGATDTVDVDFTNLHTACYQVEVRLGDQYARQKSVFSCPEYFTTGHAHPIDLIDRKADVVCQFLEGGLKINLRPLINGSTDPNQFKSRIIEERDYSPQEFMPNESNFKVLEDGMLSYQYDPLKPGNYCHGIRYLNGRCLLSTSCDCFWGQRIMVVESKPETAPKGEEDGGNDPPNSPTPFLIEIGVLTGIGILFLALTMLVFHFKRMLRAHNGLYLSPTHNEDTDENLFDGRRKIFLLYPRDCQIFMQAMEKLRMILNLNGCEVFDVWDPQLIERIRSDQMRFVQLQVADKETTTIVVASECSKLICDTYTETISVNYKEPEELDDLFLYGLKNVIENFQKKCYVVRLADQTSYEQSGDIQLAGINILENYMLPLHLEQLILNILNIRRAGGKSVVVQVQLNGAPEIGQLNSLVTELSQYKCQNPDYLLEEFISIMPRDNS